VGSDAMIYIPSFIMIGSGIQKLIRGIYEQGGDRVILLSSSSISLSCDRSIASSKVLERDCPGKVIMW
jgi:hypothetical protein